MTMTMILAMVFGLMPMVWCFFFQVITVDECFLYILRHGAKEGYCRK